MRYLTHLFRLAAIVAAVSFAGGTAQAQQYNWSGLYFGGGVGYAWADGLTDMAQTGFFNQRATPELNGGIYGGHVGINQQYGEIVVGLEAQLLNGLDGTQIVPFPPCVVGGVACLVAGTVDVHSFALYKGRLGWAGWNRWLPYITGGYATGRITSRFQDVNFNGGTNVVSDKQMHGGWVLGTGLEYAWTNHIIVGVEYLHIDLEDKIHAGFNNFGGAVPPRNHNVNADADVIMARLSFKL